MNAKPTIEPSDHRRRVCTPEEQREFARLGRLLLAADVSLEEIRKALGYDEVDGVQRVLDVARVTTDSLERLRELARSRLGEAAIEPPSSGTPGAGSESQRATGAFARERGRSQPAARTWVPPLSSPGVAPSAPSTSAAAPAVPPELTRAQQRRLRDTLDYLMASDARLRDWDLLARAAGVEGGEALRTAREGGATPRTLKNIDTFARLHAAFSSRATLALMQGIAIEDLKEHLISQRRAKTGARAHHASTHGDGAMDETQQALAEAGAGEAEPDSSNEPNAGTETGTDQESGAPRPGGVKRGPYRSRGRSKVHLTPEQHAELRTIIEDLWSRDNRLRSWTLLARAGGLGTGPAMKRAYEVNSSVTTLRNLSTFAGLQQRHGRAATDALKSGVAVEGLRSHLERSAPGASRNGHVGGERVGERGQNGTGSASRGARALDAGAAVDAARGSAAGDLTRALELGRAIDAEMGHLRRALELFEQLAGQRSAPRFLRESAGEARDHLRSVVRMFSAEEEQE